MTAKVEIKVASKVVSKVMSSAVPIDDLNAQRWCPQALDADGGLLILG